MPPPGRRPVFCPALGHAGETYADPLVRAHLFDGVNWASGTED